MSVNLPERSIPGSESEKWLDLAVKVEPPCSADQLPIVWDKAVGTRVWDVDGNEYLDLTSGVLVTNIGHCHPRMVESVAGQIARLDNSYSFRTPQRIDAAKLIVDSTPENLEQVFMLTTGAEAVEATIRLARLHTGKQEILSFHGAFHGKTYGAMSVAGSKGTKKGFGVGVPGVISAPYPYCYRCIYDKSFPDCDMHCLKVLDRIVEADSWGDLGAVIVEPYQGAAGFVFPPDGFLKALEGWAKERNLLLIVDEVQSSFGRTGKLYMIEWEDVQPNLLALGKGMGSSLPASAVVGEEEIFASVGVSGLSSTWGGNPMCSAAVIAVFDVLKREKLVENAQKMGAYLKSGFEELQLEYKILGDVRGKGLVIGLEFVDPADGCTPAPRLTYEVIMEGARQGLMLGKLGMYGNVIRIAPPLTISKEETDFTLKVFADVIAKVTGG
jgi:4-aminobutyrate aminotransferase-like enzyme